MTFYGVGILNSDRFLRELAERQFKLGVTLPITWASAARRLLISADVLAVAIIASESRQLRRMESPTYWRSGSRTIEGEELIDSDILNTSSVWAMLIALAFENVLKGIIVAKELPNLKDGEKNPIHGHSLLQLAQRAKVTISEDDANLLKELTEFSVWKGRYNVKECIRAGGGGKTRLAGGAWR
ncbi:MAG: hypothetical protein IAE77_05920, partial [Prosthecobacter sp.]|nr:hypothetical protein [Prosthecobacter sp.]